MKPKSRVKIFIDLCMAVALLLQMAQALIGELAHEWIGAGMFVLVIVHNLLNLNWYRDLLKGRYTAFRVFQLIIDIAVILAMVGLMVSGIMLSRHVFDFLPGRGGSSFARTLHMLSAYWGFVLMAFHAGIHANMMMSAARKAARISKSSKIRTTVLRTVAAFLCIYGVYAFTKRQIGTYMFLLNQFVFFDFSEPLAFFFADYIAVMVLFICAGYYISGAIRKIPARKTAKLPGKITKIKEDTP